MEHVNDNDAYPYISPYKEYDCTCFCRHNARIIKILLDNNDTIWKKKETIFTMQDIEKVYETECINYIGYSDFIVSKMSMKNAKFIFNYCLNCKECCKRHQINKPIHNEKTVIFIR